MTKPRLPNELAGLTLPELRQRYHDELFHEQLTFWDRHGIDHELGGFLCSLDYDGTVVNSDKFVWFQGRGLWVYSFLYNHFGADPAHLEVARKTKEFLFRHAPQRDGAWASVLSREGRPVSAGGGDIHGKYFAVEGLQEYAYAAGDEEAFDAAVKLFKNLFQDLNRPNRSGPEAPPACRTQGFWMVNVNIASQILKRTPDPEVAEIAGRAVEAVIGKHYNPEIGLNNERLNFDFSRPPGEEMKSNLGHSIETLWMVMAEALRRGDRSLVDVCSERIRHHLNVGWDWIYGGLALWIHVGAGAYEWPVEKVPGAGLEFHAVGEYNYTKTLWALDEVLIACLMVLEQSGAAWAAEYFSLAQRLIDERFSMKHRFGQPTYVLFADRKITPPPRSARQDNYHRLRALMLNVLALDRMIEGREP